MREIIKKSIWTTLQILGIVGIIDEIIKTPKETLIIGIAAFTIILLIRMVMEINNK